MDDLFLHISDLPKKVDKKENYELLRNINNDTNARKILIETNIRLVLYQVNNRFKDVIYDKKDLVSIGIIGLIKGVDTFDLTKKTEFSTYAIKCINNEILMFLRNLQKENKMKSYYKTVQIDDSDEFDLIETIPSEISLEESLFDKELIISLKNMMKTLPERDSEFLKMYFGFYKKKYTQKEIAEKYNVSQAHVSKVIITSLEILRKKLESNNIKYRSITLNKTLSHKKVDTSN